MSITVALDAMGGDHAPDDVVAGGVRAAAELGVRIVLVGRVDEIERVQPAAGSDVELVAAADVIGMDEPPTAVRAKKDSSVARCAQLVRDGAADAMVSAGNTGAAMAAAVLRMGRTRGVARPAVAVPVPVPGHHPQILVDAGATVDCTPEWLVQFARMGREYARTRLGVDAPTVGLLSNGEEAGKGDELRKAAHDLLAAEVPGFVGNVEGRDFMRPGVDVIVTDGFTGNVALKTIEGTIRAVASLVLRVLESTPEARGRGQGRAAAAAGGRPGARARQHRRCVAPGGAGGLRDLTRVVGGDRHRERGPLRDGSGRGRRGGPGGGGGAPCRLRHISKAAR